MYATIFDLINDLLGTNIHFPIQTFGFFVALAFIGANYTMTLELKRREDLGLLATTTRKQVTGLPASASEIGTNALLGFVLGYKLLAIVLDYAAFNAQPQDFLLSMQGNIWGGLLGAAAFAYWAYSDKEKTKLPQAKEETVVVHPYELMGTITLIAAVAGILGAKLFHNLENWDEFVANPIDALLSFSGLTFYGGLICGAGGVIYYARKHKINLLQLIDASAPGLMLSYGVGRIGCHMSGDGDWGVANLLSKPFEWLPDWAWAYTYPNNVISEGVPIPGCVGSHCMQLEQAVWPTAFYESVMCIALFFILWSMRKRITIPGFMFGLYLFFNGLERFCIERVRVNNVGEYFGIHATQAQFIAFVLMLMGAVGMFWAYTVQAKKNHA